MFKTLSASLVALSLVAVAQPASAQSAAAKAAKAAQAVKSPAAVFKAKDYAEAIEGIRHSKRPAPQLAAV